MARKTKVDVLVSSKNRSRRRKQKNNKQKSLGLAKTYGVPNSRPNRGFTLNRANEKLVSAVCSQIDPFCVHAIGAKLYDRDASRSVAYQVQYFDTITSSSSGQAAIFVRPRVVGFYATASGFSGSTVSTWGAAQNIPDETNLASLFDYYRVVNLGVRVFGTTAATASQGVVHIFTTNSVGLPDWSTSLYEEVARFPIADCDAHWIAKPFGNEYGTYQLFAASVSSMTSLYIMVSGAEAATSVLGVEVTMNLELLASEGETMSRLATDPAPHNPIIESIGSNVLRTISSTANSTTAAVGQMIRTRVVKALASGVAGYLGGPSTAMVSKAIMDVD
jgi:hypothetical protein